MDATSELLEQVDALAADIERLLDGAKGSVDWSVMRKRQPRPNPGARETVPAGRAMLHAIEHVAAHVAHMQLTRQLWQGRAR